MSAPGVWLRLLLRRRRFESEMDEEIRFHLEQATEAGMATGLPRREAYRRARVQFGAVEAHKDGMRRAFSMRWAGEVATDVAYAIRIFRKSPAFTAVAVLSIALAVGVNTAVFSLANQMLFERLAVPDAGQLRLLTFAAGEQSVIHSSWGRTWMEGGLEIHNSMPYPMFQQLQQNSQTLQSLAGFKDVSRVSITVDHTADSVETEFVSGNFFSTMRTVPALGRALQPSDDRGGAGGVVAVISHGFWQRAFHGAASAIGSTVMMNSVPVTIVGVNADGFTGAAGVQRSPEVFLPLSTVVFFRGSSEHEPLTTSTQRWWVQPIARIRPGVADGVAAAELSSLLRGAILSMTKPKAGDEIPHVMVTDGSHGSNDMGGFYRKSIYVMLGMVTLVLLLACANLANLLLARAVSRQREMSVRLALGAGRGRLLRQVLTEGLLLSLVGGGLGLLLGYVARSVIPNLLENQWMRGDLNVPFNWHVFGFVALLIVGVGLLFSALPAWRSSRMQVNVGLKEGAGSATRRRKAWTGKGLVAFQIALSTLLVVGSALFLRTLVNLKRLPTGFRVPGVVQFEVVPSEKRYGEHLAAELMGRIEEQVAALPGVQGVTLTEFPLLAGSSAEMDFKVEGVKAHAWTRGDMSQSSSFTAVSQGFFEVMGIPLLRGRSFGSQDTATSTRVAVINHVAEEKFFGATDPLGRRFSTGDDKNGPTWYTVIGVCANTRYDHMRKEPEPLHFDLMRQAVGTYGATFMVRTALPLKVVGPLLRQRVAQVDPDLPITNLQTFQDQIDDNLREERLFADMTAGFGVLALVLACIGVYGVMAYTVSQRTQEIGVRLALGAPRSQVRGMVLGEATVLAVAGVLAGLACTLLLTRVVASMLYGVPPHDPASMVCGSLLMLLVALIACWIPAARASRIDPVIALRHE